MITTDRRAPPCRTHTREKHSSTAKSHLHSCLLCASESAPLVPACKLQVKPIANWSPIVCQGSSRNQSKLMNCLSSTHPLPVLRPPEQEAVLPPRPPEHEAVLALQSKPCERCSVAQRYVLKQQVRFGKYKLRIGKYKQ